MKQIDPNEVLPEVQDMLYKLSWKYAQLSGQPFKDMLTEAYWCFMKACYVYGKVRKRGQDWRTVELQSKENPNEAKFSTWLQFMVECRLRTVSMKDHKLKAIEGNELNEEVTENLAARPQRSPALEAMDELSKDAREMVALLLDSPGDLFGVDITSPSRLLAQVKQYMVKHCAKKKHEVDQIHREVETVFGRVWQQA